MGQRSRYHGGTGVSSTTGLASLVTDLVTRYFPPHRLEGLDQVVVDGGYFAINPSGVALTESWAISSARQGRCYTDRPPDYLVSCGAGSVEVDTAAEIHDVRADSGRYSTIRQAFRESGIWQTYGFLTSTLCGNTAWRKLLVLQPDLATAGRGFRFDVPLAAPLPKLDSVGSIPHLRASAEHAFRASPEVSRLAPLILSRMFYLELTDLETCGGGAYALAGHVRSKIFVGDGPYIQFRHRILQRRTRVRMGGMEMGAIVEDQTGNLSCKFSTTIRLPGRSLDIDLHTDDGLLGSISGSPFDVDSWHATIYFQRALGSFRQTPILTPDELSLFSSPSPDATDPSPSPVVEKPATKRASPDGCEDVPRKKRCTRSDTQTRPKRVTWGDLPRRSPCTRSDTQRRRQGVACEVLPRGGLSRRATMPSRSVRVARDDPISSRLRRRQPLYRRYDTRQCRREKLTAHTNP